MLIHRKYSMDQTINQLVKFGSVSQAFFDFKYGLSRVPPCPFENSLLTSVYYHSMKVQTPVTIAIVYFSSVHYFNSLIIKRQERFAAQKYDKEKGNSKDSTKRSLPAAPFKFTQTVWFKLFVIAHNVFLWLYSVWTFVEIIKTLQNSQIIVRSHLEENGIIPSSKFQVFLQAVCDLKTGIFSASSPSRNLTSIGWFFYVSKFYEVLDTVIILVKGKPSSLLQSYHHSGAMMCMFTGIRYQSPPIWMFVAFNSFIHLLMYFYFTLSTLKVKVPKFVKKTLTSLQITQFVLGATLATVYGFIWYTDLNNKKLVSCINNPDQALTLMFNVLYLAPLTALFATFYIESYIKKRHAAH